jgi:hypothetical protein
MNNLRLFDIFYKADNELTNKLMKFILQASQNPILEPSITYNTMVIYTYKAHLELANHLSITEIEEVVKAALAVANAMAMT